MRRSREATARAALYAALAAAVLLSILGLAQDFRATREYGGVDLRNRVVGARLLREGLDPYYFKWSEAYPDTLLDPMDNPENQVSRVTVTPAALMLRMPLAGLSYSAQRMTWLFGQWLLLLASVFLFSRCARSRTSAMAVWLAGLLFSATHIWRFHVERGQVYILYVFLVALSFWLYTRPWRGAAWAAGAGLGFAAALRPTLVLMALPLLVFRKWKACGGLAAGLLVLVLVSVLVSGVSVWKSYASAMRYHENDNLGLAMPLGGEYEGMVIEGMSNLRSYQDFTDSNTSVQWQLKDHLHAEVRSGVLALLMGAAVLLMTIFLFLYRDRSVSPAALFLAGSLTVLVAEYFLPAVRPYYVNVMWLLPLELLALEACSVVALKRWKAGVGLALLAAGAFLNAAVLWRNGLVLPAETLVTLAFLWTAACLLQSSPRAGEAGAPTAEAREGRGVSAPLPPAGTSSGTGGGTGKGGT